MHGCGVDAVARQAMKLSVVVPVLNEAAGIARTLGLLAPLRARGHEVIVADGGSEDGSRELAAPLADRVIAAPRGRARQMNAGAAAAAGQALLFLHADTTLPEAADRLALQALGERLWGRFDVRIDGRSPLLPVVAFFMNCPLAPHRHRHRRPGDFRAPRGIPGFSGDRADGGHRLQPVDEAALAARLPARDA